MTHPPHLGQGFLIIEASRSHSDTPKSVVLLWMSDQPNAETSNLKHPTFTRKKHVYLGGIRTCNNSQREAVDPRL
jgi:hypothetical protein